MRQVTIFTLSAFFLAGLAGCGVFSSFTGQANAAGKENAGSGFFIAAEWNVQALFDGNETGNEYDDYREAAGWTTEKFEARLTAISQAIQQMLREDTPGGKADKQAVPDLIGFVELENSGILGSLANGALSGHGYLWTAFGNLPLSPLGIGFLSRYPFKDVRSHSITVEENTAPRPILEVRVEPRGQPLVFLLCHWKSKLGNDAATEALRRASARVVQRRLRELKESEPATPVIVMGDLNENYDEFYRHSGTAAGFLSALLPDKSGTAAMAAAMAGMVSNSLAAGEFLVLSGEKPPRIQAFPKDVPALYSPWEGELTGGTFYFRDEWETIDHFLLSESLFDGNGWGYSACHIANHAPFTTAEGFPNSYVPRTGRGLSDHLPLLLFLNFTR